MHRQLEQIEIRTHASNLVFYYVEKVDGLYQLYDMHGSGEPLAFFKRSELKKWEEKQDNVNTVIIENVWAE